MHSKLTIRDACTACTYRIVMQLSMLCRCACHMVNIRPELDRIAWLNFEAHDQQIACTTYVVQLGMSHGQHFPQMDRFADLRSVVPRKILEVTRPRTRKFALHAN